MEELNQFIQKQGNHCYEGHSGQIQAQQNRLKDLVRNSSSILEIGFNAGHSSLLFLTSSSANVISFDIGKHPYVTIGKDYLDSQYVGRHVLIIGDSLKSIPSYTISHENKRFDFIFIDGGHWYETAKGDLDNCRHLAHENTIVCMDDVVSSDHLHEPYTLGPTKAWKEAVEKGQIKTDGQEDYGHGRGMIWGKYLF